MRILKFLPIVAIVALCFAPPWSVAQQPAPPPGDAPPTLQRLEEGEAPGITIRKPDGGKKIIEQRENGKVKQIEVQSGASTYYVKPNEQAGSSVPGDTQSHLTRPAQWPVLEFDLGRRKESKEGEAVPTLEPAPPPPAAVPSSPAKN